ncbi:hypothetical protein JMJ35_009293 [Cladonia borealis]|uniref:Uncharacterized protein n=1 Tax=Cladonia borealis TaxID=184061 RepID=A0AA39QTQ9_9LECA|nr:hypothetical protein JMJ35_009293 [Cladonia borealis]
MALQVSTGYGSLLALGVGAGDIASILSLGRRVGNWWTASSGDEEFLRLLDEDELEILTRRGVIDIARFNKVWNMSITLLANGKKITAQGEQAQKVLGRLTRFTGCMVCIIATLDAFADFATVRTILYDLLLRLLKATEHGQDLLVSELQSRINAWRSAACVRSIHIRAREVRQSLIQEKSILDGLLPAKDVKEVVHFLYWMLAENTHQFLTSSSDLAGIATCLSETGFDLLSIHGFIGNSSDTPCRLMYEPSQNHSLFAHNLDRFYEKDWFSQASRGLCTAVSLVQPEESIGAFPIDKDTSHRCRYAWKRGSQASQAVELRIRKDGHQGYNQIDDIIYTPVDLGEPYERIDPSVHTLASCQGFVLNKELCNGLQQILDKEPKGIADWLLEQTAPQFNHDGSDNAVVLQKECINGTQEKINAFTVFQSFLMGYYYGVFLKLVDTRLLQLQMIDGAWGFRSVQVLTEIRACITTATRRSEGGHREGIPRHKLLEPLCSLLFSSHISIPNIGRGRSCIGVKGKRTLLIRSLVDACHTPDEMGKFLLLDIDVSGIPADVDGLIRPGVLQHPQICSFQRATMQSFRETGPSEDCTRHIEPDWDVNPETALLCIRFKGRRVATLNVVRADGAFASAYIKPVHAPSEDETPPTMPISCTIGDLVDNRLPDSNTSPVIVQAQGAPCLAYTLAAIYTEAGWPVSVASNCISTAWHDAKTNKQNLRGRAYVDIDGRTKRGKPIVIARVALEKDIPYRLVESKQLDDDNFMPYARLLNESLHQKIYSVRE